MQKLKLKFSKFSDFCTIIGWHIGRTPDFVLHNNLLSLPADFCSGHGTSLDNFFYERVGKVFETFLTFRKVLMFVADVSIEILSACILQRFYRGNYSNVYIRLYCDLNLLLKPCRVRNLFSSSLKCFTLSIPWSCYTFRRKGTSSISELWQIICSRNWLSEVMHPSKLFSDYNSRISFMNFPEFSKIFSCLLC